MVKKSSIKRTFSSILSLLLAVVIVSSAGAANLTQDQPPETPTSQIEVVSPYYSFENITTEDGSELTAHIINGPSQPLPEYEAERIASMTTVEPQGTLANFPSYSWVFGCSAVSGAMIAAWYDRGSYPNLYTGPTNNGLYPLTDTDWAKWNDGYKNYPNNPLVASHIGLDGRTTKGSIDDYWVKVDSTAPDPYINNWSQHAWGTAIGDYMKTSQSEYENPDGATVFYNWPSSSAKLTCAEMVVQGIANRDGTFGRKLFYEARGYTVTDCYNQNTDNNISGGFTLANFKTEIDAGRPVLLNLKGHSIVGYGYNGDTIYIRDTWDNNPANVYSMPWGGSYDGMELLSVSVVNLAQGSTSPSKLFLPMVRKAPPPPANPFKNPGFEQGRVSWNESSTTGFELIVPDSVITDGSVKAHGGSWLAWLGGYYNETSIISQSITITSAAPYLHFWYWIGSQDSCNWDYFYVGVNGNYFHKETICQARNTGGWVKMVINLTAYVGTGKTVQFKVTADGINNSNVFIDDVSMSASSVASQQSPVTTELFPGAALERR